MEDLGFPDLHHVRAAEGWLELGDAIEAARELNTLSEPARGHPDVLELCWRLHAMRGDWDAALAVARTLTRSMPERASGWIHQSYCLHEMKRTEEAWRLLRPAAELFPDETTIAYNLACYACQLGELAAAKEWLQRAARKQGRGPVRLMGMDDPDLVPLRAFLTEW